MIYIRPSQVPTYLQTGEFFLSLDSASDDEIYVPKDVVKLRPVIESIEELQFVLSSLRFWGVTNIPFEVMDYIFFNIEMSAQLNFWDEFQSMPLILELRKVIDSENRLRAAIQCGSVYIIEYLLQRKHPMTRDACQEAAKFGHVAVLQLLQERGCIICSDTCQVAFLHGKIIVLEFLKEKGFLANLSGVTVKFPIVSSYSDHIRVPNLETLKFAVSVGCKLNASTMNSASEKGLLDVLQYLHKMDVAWSSQGLYHAIHRNHVNCVAFMIQHGAAVDESHLLCAAKFGAVDCLKYLCKHHGPPSPQVMDTAAQFDQLACMQYLRAKHASWDEETTRIAAQHGALACLSFAVEHGCAVNTDALYAAQEGAMRHKSDSSMLAALRAKCNACVEYLGFKGL